MVFPGGGEGPVFVSEFLAMDGYGAYVWPAYGVSALALLTLSVLIYRRARRAARRLREIEPHPRNG